MSPPHSIELPAEQPFADACRQSVLGLRAALLDLYAEVGADPERPQEVSRRFNLNKNLTWKVAKIVQSEDALDAVSAIPGPGGLEILIDAMAKAGAPATHIAKVRAAVAEFDRMVETHSGDRASLELLLDSMGGQRPLELARKLAYRGNSGIWGLQARVRLTAQFLAPSRSEPGMLDFGQIAALIGVRRLRAIPRWPLFHFSRYQDDQSPLPPLTRREPLEAGGPEQLPHMMKSWCSPSMPTMHVTERPNAIQCEMGDGPIGRTGEFNCVFGHVDRASCPRYRDPHNTHGEMLSTISLPIETLLYDYFVHRSLVEALRPELSVVGQPFGIQHPVGESSARRELPIVERLVELGGSAPTVATPLFPGYDRLIETAFDRAGWDPREFTALRLVLDHPPMPSVAVLRYELPEQPASAPSGRPAAARA